MSNKKYTLVLGATENRDRYANIAIRRLQESGHPIYAFGKKSGDVNGVEIQTEFPIEAEIDTVTLYVSAKNQEEYIPKIIALQPKRVIFNPGTENRAFQEDLQKNGIEADVACTLVLLSRGVY